MRKETSTNSINQIFLFKICELNSALSIISGRWTSQIIYSIYKGNNRFSLIKKEINNISDQALGRQLKKIEKYKIIIKLEIPDVKPVGTQYILTDKGKRLISILESLCNWGKGNIEE